MLKIKKYSIEIRVLDNQAIFIYTTSPEDFGREEGKTVAFEEPSKARDYFINRTAAMFDEAVNV